MVFRWLGLLRCDSLRIRAATRFSFQVREATMNRFLTGRRSFLGMLAGLPGLGGLLSAGRATAADSVKARDVIQELGVRSFINAAGTYTALTGSLMSPEVIAAVQVASRKYVRLEELHDAVG